MKEKVDKLIGKRVVVKSCSANWHGDDNRECLCSLIGKTVVIERKESFPICETSLYNYYLKGNNKKVIIEDIYSLEGVNRFIDIVKKIDLELESFNREIKNINVSVQQDLQLLIEEYSKHEELHGEKFKQEYLDILKRKKLDAVSQAIDKLQRSKNDIWIVLDE